MKLTGLHVKTLSSVLSGIDGPRARSKQREANPSGGGRDMQQIAMPVECGAALQERLRHRGDRGPEADQKQTAAGQLGGAINNPAGLGIV